MSKQNVLNLGAMLLGLAVGNAVAADAQSQLDGMAMKLAQAKQFSVAIHMSYDVVQASGQQIQFSEIREVQVNRPDQLRIDSRHSNGDVAGLIFDGKALTLFHNNKNVYSQVDYKGNVDAAIRYSVASLGIRVPLARMLVTTLPQELQKLNQSIEYVEKNALGPEPADHIAARTKDVDYQVWIAENQLPQRIVITYKNEPGQPQFQADFSNWNLSPKFSDTTFAFSPPEGAEKISILIAKGRAKSDATMKGGDK